MKKIAIKKITCRRCGHRWQPRVEDVKECPACKSRDFEKSKKKRQ